MAGTVVTKTARKLSLEGLQSIGGRVLPVGTVLCSMYGSIGKTAMVGVPLATNQAIAAGVANADVIDPTYLYYAVSERSSLLDSMGRGATQRNINRRQLEAVQIRVPPRIEQRRIVDLLTSADAVVEALHTELLASQEARRQVILGGLNTHRHTEGVALVKLGDVAETQLGKMLNSANQTGVGARPYLRAANITAWGKLDTSDLKTMDFADTELAKFSVQPGDLLVTEGGDAGRCVVYTGLDGMAYQNHIHRVRADTSKTSNDYVALVLESLSVTGQLDRYCSTTTIKMLSVSSLKSIELVLPPLPDQQSILKTAAAATARVETLDNRLQRAKAVRDQLLHDLLSGIHTIPESYDRFLEQGSV
jgi:type I restriction enzyme S subunit